MIFAAPGDTGYDIMLLLHILTAMVAFAPVFVHPLLANQAGDGGVRGTLMGLFAGNGRRIYAPALILSGLLGFGVAGMSDEVYSVGDGWIIAAILVWIAQNGLLHAMVIPGQRAMAEGDDTAEQKVSLGEGLIVALLVVQLVLMVFKPGA